MLYIVSDHGGFGVKRQLTSWLEKKKILFQDLGPDRVIPRDDYPQYATVLAKKVAASRSHRGIAICRTGVGMAIAANKHRNIRAVQAVSPIIVSQSRRDENTNVLSLAADHQTWPEIQKMVLRWLTTPYKAQSRHARRLREISQLEYGR